jgi:exodeoxyribonuclease V alpha subunit
VRRESTLEGVVDRIVYANEETGWSVLRLVVRGRGQVTAVGNLVGVQPGESLRLSGHWGRDRKYGDQFRVDTYLTVQPSTFIGIEKYLSSGLVKGIGPAMARRLVQHFGLDTLDVIEHRPERLKEVEGIGPVRSARIRDAWMEQREIKDVMIFLQSHGVSTAYAVKIYKRYGSAAIGLVRENPYRLAEEVYGIGFKLADKIARDLGIAADSQHRLAAGVLYALRRAADKGHVYALEGDLLRETAELLGVDAEAAAPAVGELVARGELARQPIAGELSSSFSPLPLGEGPGGEGSVGDSAVFLKALETAERGVAERVRTLTAQRELPLKIDVERACQWFERREAIELGAAQRRALQRALTSKLLVLTGGPGTGKTTLVRGIVAILARKGLKVELAAPTGRAAKRLGEATGHDAMTVHRLLEYSPRQGGFTRDEEHPLDADLVVVDEASMLDVVLSFHLLKAVRQEARLILVGDVDQLPSVGPGRVLADLIESGAVDVVRLTEIFRQAGESLIVVNAHRVRDGEMPHLVTAERGDFFFIERDEPEAVLATVKHLVKDRIPGGFGFSPRDVQVLSPMQRGPLGAVSLNAELQNLVNPDGESITRGRRLLRAGDRVMQVRNNYDLEVYNGDVGYVETIDVTDQIVRVDYGDERRVEYEFSDLDELTLAYACSIHKSQGSEYTAVVIPLHTQHFVMLQRNLLYTAITRGRRLVVIVGSRRALALAVRTESSSRRSTLLVRRLRGG